MASAGNVASRLCCADREGPIARPSPLILPVDDPQDERIAAYRDIRERDLVGRQGRFVAEGVVVLRNLIATPLCRPISLLIDRKRIEALASLIDTIPAGVPIYAAAQSVLDGVAGFPLHRGILAIGERIAAPTASELIAKADKDAPIVVLAGIANHDNMGGIFRNAAAFGVGAIILDATCCDPLYRKAIRVSVGAALRVPFARLGENDDLVAIATRANRIPIALGPKGGEPLHSFAANGPVCLFFGTEGDGLPAAVMERCRLVSIPMAAGFDSLNVATTTGIVLHHFVGGASREMTLAANDESPV